MVEGRGDRRPRGVHSAGNSGAPEGLECAYTGAPTVPLPAKPTPLACKLVGLLKQAVATDGQTPQAPLVHKFCIKRSPERSALTLTLVLWPDDVGRTFLITCRELPELLAFGEDEEEALEMGETAIREALAAETGEPSKG
jgi:predicted RNase H-like HicB family nuclease